MFFMIWLDCHNHSKFSFDGEFEVEEMIAAAKAKNISVFAVTDHCEVNMGEDKLEANIQACLNQVNALKLQMTEIKLIAGIELGQPLQERERAFGLLRLEGLDFVIGSLHNIANEEDFYFMDFAKCSDNEIMDILSRYYEEQYEMALWGEYDTMAHITYPYRYMTKERVGREVQFDVSRFDVVVESTYRHLIANGKAIELNSGKSFQENQYDRNLMRHYLEMYYRLGGELVTIGSDAHTPQGVGGGLEQAYHMLKEVGFQYVTYFEKRKPIMVKI